MALSMAITMADTNLQLNSAYGRIDDSRLSNANTNAFTQIFLGWYTSQANAASGYKPVRTDQIPIPPGFVTTPNPAFVSALATAVQAGLIQSPLDALKTALYLLIKAQPTYSTAVDA